MFKFKKERLLNNKQMEVVKKNLEKIGSGDFAVIERHGVYSAVVIDESVNFEGELASITAKALQRCFDYIIKHTDFVTFEPFRIIVIYSDKEDNAKGTYIRCRATNTLYYIQLNLAHDKDIDSYIKTLLHEYAHHLWKNYITKKTKIRYTVDYFTRHVLCLPFPTRYASTAVEEFFCEDFSIKHFKKIAQLHN